MQRRGGAGTAPTPAGARSGRGGDFVPSWLSETESGTSPGGSTQDHAEFGELAVRLLQPPDGEGTILLATQAVEDLAAHRDDILRNVLESCPTK